MAAPFRPATLGPASPLRAHRALHTPPHLAPLHPSRPLRPSVPQSRRCSPFKPSCSPPALSSAQHSVGGGRLSLVPGHTRAEVHPWHHRAPGPTLETAQASGRLLSHAPAAAPRLSIFLSPSRSVPPGGVSAQKAGNARTSIPTWPMRRGLGPMPGEHQGCRYRRVQPSAVRRVGPAEPPPRPPEWPPPAAPRLPRWGNEQRRSQSPTTPGPSIIARCRSSCGPAPGTGSWPILPPTPVM